MKQNTASADRIIRVILGIAGVVLAITLGGLWWIAGAVGVVLLATAAFGFCPLYALLGVRTKKDAA